MRQLDMIKRSQCQCGAPHLLCCEPDEPEDERLRDPYTIHELVDKNDQWPLYDKLVSELALAASNTSLLEAAKSLQNVIRAIVYATPEERSDIRRVSDVCSDGVRFQAYVDDRDVRDAPLGAGSREQPQTGQGSKQSERLHPESADTPAEKRRNIVQRLGRVEKAMINDKDILKRRKEIENMLDEIEQRVSSARDNLSEVDSLIGLIEERSLGLADNHIDDLISEHQRDAILSIYCEAAGDVLDDVDIPELA